MVLHVITTVSKLQWSLRYWQMVDKRQTIAWHETGRMEEQKINSSKMLTELLWFFLLLGQESIVYYKMNKKIDFPKTFHFRGVNAVRVKSLPLWLAKWDLYPTKVSQTLPLIKLNLIPMNLSNKCSFGEYLNQMMDTVSSASLQEFLNDAYCITGQPKCENIKLCFSIVLYSMILASCLSVIPSTLLSISLCTF